MEYKYFSNRDFQNATPSCNMSEVDSELLEMLDIARFFAGIPFIINSAYRTLGWEIQKGRDGSSSHCKGKAVDIRTRNSRERYLIIKGLLHAGFERIGVGDGFVHCDVDDSKDPEVIWDYYVTNED